MSSRTAGVPVAKRTQRTKRTLKSFVGGALLNLAAAGGVVCIAAVIAALAFNITLIMFKTGSMSPTIPAGSLSVVKEIPAADINVGDVVTVDRTGKLPVTHRVTSVSKGAVTLAASPCVATPTVLTTRLRTPSARYGSCSSRSRDWPTRWWLCRIRW